RLVERDLTDAARKLGIVDPLVAASLIKDKLEFDDDGSPSNAEPLLRALVKDKPYLASAQKVGGSPTNPPTSPSSQQTFTTSQLEDIEFYLKNEAAIKLAMREGRIIKN